MLGRTPGAATRECLHTDIDTDVRDASISLHAAAELVARAFVNPDLAPTRD